MELRRANIEVIHSTQNKGRKTMSLHWGASIKSHIDTVTAFVPIATAPVSIGAYASVGDLLTYVSLGAALCSIIWNGGRIIGAIFVWLDKFGDRDNEP